MNSVIVAKNLTRFDEIVIEKLIFKALSFIFIIFDLLMSDPFLYCNQFFTNISCFNSLNLIILISFELSQRDNSNDTKIIKFELLRHEIFVKTILQRKNNQTSTNQM